MTNGPLKYIFTIALLSISTINYAIATTDNTTLRARAKSVIGVIPNAMPGSDKDTPAMIALGEKLYFETALSINNSQSCNSCHNLLKGGHGVDNLKVSLGAMGKPGRRNAPSTWNAGFQFAQNWDANAKSLEEQGKGPLLNSKEMALPSKEEAVKRVKHHKKAFKKAFPNSKKAISFEHITRALAAFQRTLVTSDRFNDFIEGDDEALSEQEKRGFLLFQQNGCSSCHSGPLMGGQFIMKLGVVIPYPNTEDKGYAEVTGREEHNYLFKVPMLRNVANTEPYFHDGAGQTLDEAVFLTGWHQLGKKLRDEEVREISAFLVSLNNTKTYSKSEHSIHE